MSLPRPRGKLEATTSTTPAMHDIMNGLRGCCCCDVVWGVRCENGVGGCCRDQRWGVKHADTSDAIVALALHNVVFALKVVNAVVGNRFDESCMYTGHPPYTIQLSPSRDWARSLCRTDGRRSPVTLSRSERCSKSDRSISASDLLLRSGPE